jgi:hypothetical protein
MKVNRYFGGTWQLHLRVEKYAKQDNSMKQALLAACVMLFSCLAYSSTLELEAQ